MSSLIGKKAVVLGVLNPVDSRYNEELGLSLESKPLMHYLKNAEVCTIVKNNHHSDDVWPIVRNNPQELFLLESKSNSQWLKREQFCVIDDYSRTYEAGDRVSFNVGGEILTYELASRYLLNKAPTQENHLIFQALGIQNQREFCSKIYGYEQRGGNFPEWQSGDLEAGNRIIHVLKSLSGEIGNFTPKCPCGKDGKIMVDKDFPSALRTCNKCDYIKNLITKEEYNLKK